MEELTIESTAGGNHPSGAATHRENHVIFGKVMNHIITVVQSICHTFKIDDWSLFA